MKLRIMLTLCCALCFVLLGGCGRTYMTTSPPNFESEDKLLEEINRHADDGWELVSPAHIYLNQEGKYVLRLPDDLKSAQKLLWVK